MWYNVNKVAIKMLNFTNFCKFNKLIIPKCKFHGKEYSIILKEYYKKWKKCKMNLKLKKLAK